MRDAADSNRGNSNSAEADVWRGLGKIQLSSVFRDLLDLRRVVAEAAKALAFTPILTEDITAHGRSVADVCRDTLASCDTYVGLFSKARGTVPTGESRAITEREWRLARALGLRCLVFYDAAARNIAEPGLKAFLDDEVAAYRTGVYPRRYRDESDLERKLRAALSFVRPRLTLALTRNDTGYEARRLCPRDV
jgi:hypothetical protein